MLSSLLEVHFLCCFSAECQALIWKLDTNLSVAARTTSTFLTPTFNVCRKAFYVMGMSSRPFFTNKKASGNWKRAGETAWTVRLCSYLKLPHWNQPDTVTFSHTFSHQLAFLTLCSNAYFFFFIFNFPLPTADCSCNITLH